MIKKLYIIFLVFFINFIYFNYYFINLFNNNSKIDIYNHLNILNEWKYRASIIYEKNKKQNKQIVTSLSNKWNNKTLYGLIDPWNLFLKLNNVIDLTDNRLLSTTQYYHALQVFQAMINDNIKSEKLLFLALYHDIGKILILFDEEQSNVMCSTFVIYKNRYNNNFNNIIISWNHDEFGYQKLKNYVSKDIAWVIRYHSLTSLYENKINYNLSSSEKKYLKLATIFRKYDRSYKNILNVNISKFNITYAKEIIDKILPNKIIF